MNLLKKLLQGNKLAIARVISDVENESNAKILEKIFPYTVRRITLELLVHLVRASLHL